MEKEIVLQAEHISKIYRTRRFGLQEDLMFPAVNDVSFQIQKGETLGLAGESGCGKSTIAKLLTGLLKLDEGKIIFQGKDIRKRKRTELRKMRVQLQMIQQNPFQCMDPHMKISTLLGEAVKEHQIIPVNTSMDDYLSGILKECDLSAEYLKRYPNELSGGQLQRLAIARSLALNPDFIIADEIVSALDVTVQNQILKLLMRLKQERNLSMLFISHDLAVVHRISDRIMVMKEGSVVDSGSADTLFQETTCGYTKELLKSIVQFPF